MLEISRYTRNQLLRDSDVMSMFWGLQLRVPLVDRYKNIPLKLWDRRWSLALLDRWLHKVSA
mgnify:CR=1 FL=1